MGLVMIERLASNFTVRQTTSMVIGMVVCTVIVLWNEGPRFAERYRYTLILPAILLLTLGVVVSFAGTDPTDPGRSVLNITDRFGIQPSEPLKLFLVLFLAGFLDFHREKFQTVRLRKPFQDRRWLWVFIPLLGMWGISMMLLVLQRDLGAALLFFAIFLVLAYLATQRLDYVILSLGFFALGTFAAYQLFSYVGVRFAVWLDPWSDPEGAGFQLIQALLAFGHGSIIGQGLGQGYPGFVPIVHSDFIVAAIGEEWGLAGVIGVIGLYLYIMWRGFQIALRAPDSFEQLVAGGLTALLIVQTLIIMAGSLKLLPLTGITLPFISYGGTSLMTSYALLGIVLRISREQVEG
jgi:cell division protein FtsW (lipid II flippase)